MYVRMSRKLGFSTIIEDDFFYKCKEIERKTRQLESHPKTIIYLKRSNFFMYAQSTLAYRHTLGNLFVFLF